MNTLSDYQRGYIEGCLDSDGSISMSKPSSKAKNSGYSPKVRVSFSNNSTEFLLKIQNILGVSMKLVLKKGSKNYRFAVGQNESEKLLEQIQLVIKENRRKIALEYIKFKRESNVNAYTITDTYKEKVDSYVELFRTS